MTPVLPISRLMERRSPLWLAHHHPNRYDRCVRVGRHHVCRRCAVLYPLAFGVMLLTISRRFPLALDAALLVILPLPAVAEYLGEALGRLRHVPRRQALLTTGLALGLGRGFARYLRDPSDLLFWGVVASYGGLCLAATLVQWHRERSGIPALAARTSRREGDSYY